MKKILLFVSVSVSVFFLFFNSSNAQVFSDDFEAYVVGQRLACQNPVDWTTWTNSPCSAVEDAMISSNFAFSGTKSVVIAPNNDLVRLHENITSGIWYQDFMVYIPAGKAGYFNNLSDFTFGTGGYWAMECYFDLGGGGRLVTGSTVTFAYPNGSWFQVSLVVNLGTDQASLTVDNVLVNTWQWTLGASGGSGPLVLDAADFFGATVDDEMYVDNYRFSDTPVPVELTSFTANANNGYVQLNWTTATETNNHMFEIQRQAAYGEFFSVGFVNGQGTTTEPHEYSYIDRTVTTGTYSYRLKQIDYDGHFSYSPTVEVEVHPTQFVLEQNYPNPFNPTTNIKFGVPESGFVKLAVFNIVGEEVAVLVNGNIEAGVYDITFDARNLPSGAYFYKLESEKSVEVKKMLLTK